MQCLFVMHLHPEDSDTFFLVDFIVGFFSVEALTQNTALPAILSSSCLFV